MKRIDILLTGALILFYSSTYSQVYDKRKLDEKIAEIIPKARISPTVRKIKLCDFSNLACSDSASQVCAIVGVDSTYLYLTHIDRSKGLSITIDRAAPTGPKLYVTFNEGTRTYVYNIYFINDIKQSETRFYVGSNKSILCNKIELESDHELSDEMIAGFKRNIAFWLKVLD